MSSASPTPSGGSYLLSETARTIEEVAARNQTHVSAVYRWIKSGLCGGKVKLEAYYRASKWITSDEAVIRFFDSVNAVRHGAEPVTTTEPSGRTPAQRLRDSERAAREAEALGV